MTQRTARFFLGAAVALAPLAASAGPAVLDQDAGDATDLSVTLFLPIETTGTSAIGGIEGDVDLDLNDVLSLLDFGLAARAESWRNGIGIIADGNYVSLSEDTRAEPGPFGGADIEVNVSQVWAAILGGYQVSKGTYGDNGNRYSFDVQGGIRYNSLKQTIKVKTPMAKTSRGGTETWFEPVIAARGVWELNDNWSVSALADAGGFGVGDNDLAWSATVGFGYEFGDANRVDFGWRHYSIDFETDRSDGLFKYDFTQSGPFIGYTREFR